MTVELRSIWRSRPGALELGDRRRYLGALLALLIGDAAFAFQQTAVIPALPTIEHDLHSPARWTVWLLSGYLVIASISAPLLGRLGDRRGKRLLLIVALACFLVGSVGAALAPGIGILILFRALQGVGGAVFPLSQSVVRDEFPEEELGVGIGWLTGAFGLGAAAGFGLGGVIAAALSWRFIFAVGAVVILVATALVRLFVPRSPVRTEAALDGPGAALLAAGLTVVLVVVTEGVHWGWGSGRTVGGFALGAALLAGWIARELRAEEPLVDLGALVHRPVLFANLASFMLGYVLFGAFFLVPHLVQARPGGAGGGYGFGASAVGAGLYLLPAGLAQVAAGPISGFVARRLSAKWPFAGGLALAAAGAAVLAIWHDQPWQVVVGMLVLGIGIGFGIGLGGTLVAQSVAQSETGVATALNSVLRRVGGAVGGQVAAALLAALTLSGMGAPAESAFVAAFWASAAVALAGTVCALLVPRAAERMG